MLKQERSRLLTAVIGVRLNMRLAQEVVRFAPHLAMPLALFKNKLLAFYRIMQGRETGRRQARLRQEIYGWTKYSWLCCKRALN